MMKLCLITLFSYFLIGCSTQNLTSANINLDDLPGTINLKINQAHHQIPLSKYNTIKHYRDGTTSITIRDPAQKPLIEPPVLNYTGNSQVTVAFDVLKHPELKIFFFDRKKNKEVQVKIKKNIFNLPEQVGTYDYYIQALWSNAEATYTFSVNIK